MDNLPKVSIVVPTRNRPKDVADLLLTVSNQRHPPFEVIIVDDSREDSTKQVADHFSSKLGSIHCELKYAKGAGDGVPTARNLGVRMSEGDAILFLDDDTLLDRNVVSTLATFLRDHPVALGVQPKISSSARNLRKGGLAEKFENAVCKALMLFYRKKDELAVRRSGVSVFPDCLTKVISVQRLSGCCSCYKREVFSGLSYDTNLKGWGFTEDLGLSYTVYKRNPRSLYAVPHAEVIHKGSREARLPTKPHAYMTTVYGFYTFFKDVFESSVLNLAAFLWRLIGGLVTVIGGLVAKRKQKHRWWELVYLIESYVYAFRHLKEITRRDLDFFSEYLRE